MKVWMKILIAIGAGALFGVLLGEKAEMLKPIGTIFINLLSLLVVPLIFSSMVLGIVNSPDTKTLGRVGGTSLLLYITATILAIFLGIGLAYSLELGMDLQLTVPETIDSAAVPSFQDLLVSLVPKNPVHAFAEGNILQIILFSILFGFAVKLTQDLGKPIVHFVQSLSHVVFRMTHMVMSLAPYGVFALIAWATGSLGLEVLLPVGKFLLSYYLGCVLFLTIVIGGGVFLITRLNPLYFFKGLGEAVAMAASTCSSSATLPSTIHCVSEKLGVSPTLAQFLIPLGTSVNMNGSSLFQTMAAIFIANAYGIDLEMRHLLILSTTVGLSSIGTAMIPGGGLLMLSIVLSSIGLPLEGIAILASIDRLRDMATTMLNITSDAACAVCVAKLEGAIDESIYYQTNSQIQPAPVSQ